MGLWDLLYFQQDFMEFDLKKFQYHCHRYSEYEGLNLFTLYLQKCKEMYRQSHQADHSLIRRTFQYNRNNYLNHLILFHLLFIDLSIDLEYCYFLFSINNLHKLLLYEIEEEQAF